jgi:hypothetical protein
MKEKWVQQNVRTRFVGNKECEYILINYTFVLLKGWLSVGINKKCLALSDGRMAPSVAVLQASKTPKLAREGLYLR